MTWTVWIGLKLIELVLVTQFAWYMRTVRRSASELTEVVETVRPAPYREPAIRLELPDDDVETTMTVDRGRWKATVAALDTMEWQRDKLRDALETIIAADADGPVSRKSSSRSR
jgi:hypothetical protein